MAKKAKPAKASEGKRVEALRYPREDATRKNIPTAELQSVLERAGSFVVAEGRYMEGEGDAAVERRAGIFIGPEFGTVTRPDLVAAAREAGDANFDVLIACAFNYGAHATEFSKYGALKTTLRAEIDEAAWATLHSDTSRPFPRPKSGRIAVKVINHLGDEVMKVFRVS